MTDRQRERERDRDRDRDTERERQIGSEERGGVIDSYEYI